MNKPDGGPAFPYRSAVETFGGMSLRDVFAAVSLLGQRTKHGGYISCGDSERFAERAWADANAMIAERDKQ